MRIIKKLILPFMIGCIIFCVLALLRYGIDHWLGDCLSITGFLMMGYAGLVFVAHEGTFNIVTYGFLKFFDMFRKNPHVTVKYEEYLKKLEVFEKEVDGLCGFFADVFRDKAGIGEIFVRDE